MSESVNLPEYVGNEGGYPSEYIQQRKEIESLMGNAEKNKKKIIDIATSSKHILGRNEEVAADLRNSKEKISDKEVLIYLGIWSEDERVNKKALKKLENDEIGLVYLSNFSIHERIRKEASEASKKYGETDSLRDEIDPLKTYEPRRNH